jgi:hypothetical protein
MMTRKSGYEKFKFKATVISVALIENFVIIKSPLI